MTTELPISCPTTLRATLLTLARLEEQRALADAATVPYWRPWPPSVDGHNFAAAALRDAADMFSRGGEELAS
jgi:hypothetical protein